MHRFPFCAAIVLACVTGGGGCWSKSQPEVIVYAALDAEFSRPILQQFERETGIRVRPKFDTEATKSVGLTNTLIAEAQHPRADVFWNNEILNTLRLESLGLLEPYHAARGEAFPATFRAPDGYWHGLAGRARVILVNTDEVPPDAMPTSIEDLCDERFRGRIGIGKPLFGMTATHAACLFAAWGDERAEDYFRRLKANDVQILAGNKQVAQAVSSGRLAFGLTDTDDAIIELEQGRPVKIVFPDSRPDQDGTLLIPNTLSIIAGGPNPEAARRLVEYLLGPEVEAQLAAGPSAQIPLAGDVEATSRVAPPGAIKAMEVDFREAAAKWDRTAEFLRQEFELGP